MTLFKQGGWTRWPTVDPTNLTLSVFLWLKLPCVRQKTDKITRERCFDRTDVLDGFCGFEFVSELRTYSCLVPAAHLCFGSLAEATPVPPQPDGADSHGADPYGAEPAAAARLLRAPGPRSAPPRPPAALWALIGSRSADPATTARWLGGAGGARRSLAQARRPPPFRAAARRRRGAEP